MRRIWGVLSIVILITQTACYKSEKSPENGGKPTAVKVVENAPKADFPPPLEADFKTEKAEAQKLFDSGIAFEKTNSAHGIMTDKGVSFGSNEFKSSDGVELSRYGKLYETEAALQKSFEDAAIGAEKIFEKKDLGNGVKMLIGASDKAAFIVNTEGNYLYTVSCVSLRHLLAFEMKEPNYFGYKTAKQ